MTDIPARLTTALESRYRLGREVGVGGMATVYLAHDLRHERDVAIKVLHPDLAAALGAERFLAEIKTTAKLHHPHILPLLDSGEANGLLYYVMPYVAGESLRVQLERETQLAVDDAVRIAREVASALDYAHRHGVVHRDIKPENILIHENQALVADFGIALAVSAAGGPRMTQTGLSLGTPAYMAPEQAMGERAIDGRADIYALGAVLYEMLVGEAPFTGPTVQAIVARVMTESPRPVTGQRKSVPAHVNAAVLRALEKLPADRFHSPAEFSTALVTTIFEPAEKVSAIKGNESRASSLIKRSWIPWAVAGVASAAAIALAFSRDTGRADTGPLHLSIDLPSDFELPPGEAEMIGISDDGMTVGIGAQISGRSALALRRLDGNSFRIVQAVPGQAITDMGGSAAFSPDGKWVAFDADGKLWKVSLAGGAPTPIAASRWGQATWAGNDAVVFTKNYDTGLYKFSAEGRDSTQLTVPDRKKGELGHWWPQLLPDGEHILFTNYTTPADRSNIEALSLKTGKRTLVLEGGYYARYVRNHLVFARGEGLMVVRFNPSRLRTTGGATPLPLEVELDPPNGWAAFAVSSNGTLVYRTDAYKHVRLLFLDEGGNEEVAVDSTARYTSAVVSPDNRRIATVRDGDIWIYDRQRKLFSRLTRTEQREVGVIWTPDSKALIYARDVPQYDIFRRAADGSTPEELLITSKNDKIPEAVSLDGQTLIYSEDFAGDDLFTMPLSPPAPQSNTPLIRATGSQNAARISPDGLWMVYSSSESGRAEVYLSPYPINRGPSRQQLSDAGGTSPRWGPDGRTVYFASSGRIHRIRVNPRTGEIGTPEILSRIAPVLGWDIGSDGRFIAGRLPKGRERHSINVILNWASSLDAKN